MRLLDEQNEIESRLEPKNTPFREKSGVFPGFFDTFCRFDRFRRLHSNAHFLNLPSTFRMAEPVFARLLCRRRIERPQILELFGFFGVDRCGGRLCVISLRVLPVRFVGVGARQGRSLAGSAAVPGLWVVCGLGGSLCCLAGVVVSPLAVGLGCG